MQFVLFKMILGALLTSTVLSVANLSDTTTIICYYKSIDDKLEVSLKNVTFLLGTKYLDISKDTMIFTFGYLGHVDGNTTRTIILAYVNNTDKNVCLLNWEATANAGPDGLNYPTVAESTQIVGKQAGQAIVALVQGGLVLTKLLLIGFSLGCPLWGATSREMKRNGCNALTIVGLDCAGPSFDGPLPLITPLRKTDADFVPCYHTDPGRYGITAKNCHLDVFINFGEYYKLLGTKQQPGCNQTLQIDDFCSHSRSVLLWADSLQYPDQLECSEADNYPTWVKNNGARVEVTVMGENVNRSATGTYFMSTNAQSPYGKGDDGLKP